MTPRKRNPGRPRLAKAKARGIVLCVRLTPAERRAVEASADAAEQSVSEWVRSTLVAAASAPAPV